MPPKARTSEPAPKTTSKVKVKAKASPVKKAPRKSAPAKITLSKADKRKVGTGKESEEEYTPVKRKTGTKRKAGDEEIKAKRGRRGDKVKREEVDEAREDEGDGSGDDAEELGEEEDVEEAQESDPTSSPAAKRAKAKKDQAGQSEHAAVFKKELADFEAIFQDGEQEYLDVLSGDKSTEARTQVINDTLASYDRAIEQEGVNVKRFYSSWNDRATVSFNELAAPVREWMHLQKASVHVLKEAAAECEKRPVAIDAAAAAFERKQKEVEDRLEEHAKATTDSRAMIKATRRFLREIRA